MCFASHSTKSTLSQPCVINLIAYSHFVNHVAYKVHYYKSILRVIQEVCRRWEQLAADHQEFSDAVHNCAESHKDIAGRLDACSAPVKDNTAAAHQLERLRDVLAGKEAGFTRLQTVIDSAQVVTANTAPNGRQQVRLRGL